jgi:hypothetical protein
MVFSQNQMIWAYGPYENDIPKSHLVSNNTRGAAQMYFMGLPKNAISLGSMVGLVCLSVFSLLVY